MLSTAPKSAGLIDALITLKIIGLQQKMRRSDAIDKALRVTGRQKLNFYGLAVTPNIDLIRASTTQLMQTYQDYVPGSKLATSFLLSMVDECRHLIKQLLHRSSYEEECSVEFVAGTCRAIEVALARASKPQKIIISPFEHPSVVEVAKWFTSIAGSSLCRVQFEAEMYFRSWQEQEDRLIAEVLSEAEGGDKTAVLILSEVNYATGVVIPVEPIIERISRAVGSSSIEVIIDGAHAIGNNLYPGGIHNCASYVFSAHKWLLAPEPCGVIVSYGDTPRQAGPYDAWSRTLPATTVNVNMIAGLLSALRLIEEIGMEELWDHSRKLREQFVERTRSSFMVVGEKSGMKTTLLLAICPRPGRRWKYSARELSEFLEENSVHVLVISIDPQMPWIRVGFPFFIAPEQVDILCDVLERTLD